MCQASLKIFFEYTGEQKYKIFTLMKLNFLEGGELFQMVNNIINTLYKKLEDCKVNECFRIEKKESRMRWGQECRGKVGDAVTA